MGKNDYVTMMPESTDKRPEEGTPGIRPCHGKKCKDEPAVLTIAERKAGYYLTLRIMDKTVAGGNCIWRSEIIFSKVFRSMMTDNGSEFAALSEMEAYGTKVRFAHPYSSWERSGNGRSNRILRYFIPKRARSRMDEHAHDGMGSM